MSDEELIENAIARVLERWTREQDATPDELKDIGEEGEDEHGNL